MGDDERVRVLALVRRHGWNATAFQTLESGYRYFFWGEDACAAYVDTGRAWVVAGAPVAAYADLPAVVAALSRGARAAGRRLAFFATETRFKIAVPELRSLLLGEQPVWDPRHWSGVLSARRSLREQLRRARAKGVRVRELTRAELESAATREALDELKERWLSTRGMASLEFLVQVDLFSFPEHRACFIAERGEAVVGLAAIVPVPARDGLLLEDLLRAPDAPNGTGELLVDFVMRWAAERQRAYVTLGLAPLSGNVTPALRAARRTASFLYDFEGLRTYKAKLGPTEWAPIYLSYPATQGAILSIWDSLSAFTPRGLPRFALASLLRGPTFVVRTLTLLLAPWIALLALAPVDPWFGANWVKWGWITFDLLVLMALARYLRNPATGSLTPLAIAVSADALITALQAGFWNLPRARHAIDYAVILAACSAPPLAAVVLWGARQTRARARPPRAVKAMPIG